MGHAIIIEPACNIVAALALAIILVVVIEFRSLPEDRRKQLDLLEKIIHIFTLFLIGIIGLANESGPRQQTDVSQEITPWVAPVNLVSDVEKMLAVIACVRSRCLR